MVFRNTLKLTNRLKVSVKLTCYKNKQTNQNRSKQNKKEDELPLHAHSDILRYVPLQLYYNYTLLPGNDYFRQQSY